MISTYRPHRTTLRAILRYAQSTNHEDRDALSQTLAAVSPEFRYAVMCTVAQRRKGLDGVTMGEGTISLTLKSCEGSLSVDLSHINGNELPEGFARSYTLAVHHPLSTPTLKMELAVRGQQLPTCIDWWIARPSHAGVPIGVVLHNACGTLRFPREVYENRLRYLSISSTDQTVTAEVPLLVELQEQLPVLQSLMMLHLRGPVLVVWQAGSRAQGVRAKKRFLTLIGRLCQLAHRRHHTLREDGSSQVSPFLPALCNLRQLTIRGYDGPLDGGLFEQYPGLVSLSLVECEGSQWTNMERLRVCRELRHLEVVSVPEFARVARLLLDEGTFPMLRSLLLVDCGVNDIDWVCAVRDLRYVQANLLTALPKGLSNPEMLSEVSLRGAAITSLAPWRGCTLLKALDLSNCRKLTSLVDLAGHPTLTILHLQYSAVANLDGLATCKSLEYVKASKCRRLSGVRSISGALSLRRIILSDCGVRALEGLSECPLLEEVDISYCRELSSLSGLEDSPSLRRLEMVRTRLRSLEGLEGCGSLEVLIAKDNRELMYLDALRDLTRLRTVDVRKCKSLTNIAGLMGSAGLCVINLAQCSPYLDLSPLRVLRQLESLELTAGEHLETLDELFLIASPRASGYVPVSLRSVTIEDAESLTNIDALCVAAEHSLEKLIIRDCESYNSPSQLSRLRNLHHLELIGCCALTDISFLAGENLPRTLERLFLTFSNVKDFTPIGNLTSLRELDLLGNRHLTDLSFLQCLAASRIDGSPAAAPLPRLRELNIRCTRVTSLGNVAQWAPSLRILQAPPLMSRADVKDALAGFTHSVSAS